MDRKKLLSFPLILFLIICCSLLFLNTEYSFGADFSCKTYCKRVDKNLYRCSFEVINNTNYRTIGRLDDIRIYYNYQNKHIPSHYETKVIKLKNIRCSIPPLESKKYKFTIKSDSDHIVTKLRPKMTVRWERDSSSSSSSSSFNSVIARPNSSSSQHDKVSVSFENKLDKKISVALQWREGNDSRKRCRGWYVIEAGKSRTITIPTTYEATRRDLGYYATSGNNVWSSSKNTLRGPIKRPDKFYLWEDASGSSIRQVNYRPIKVHKYSDGRGGRARIVFQY